MATVPGLVDVAHDGRVVRDVPLPAVALEDVGELLRVGPLDHDLVVDAAEERLVEIGPEVRGQDRQPVVYNGVTYDPRVMSSFTALTWDTVSPRLGASYALTGDNKTVLKASFGRYYSSAISNWFVGINPNGAITWRQALGRTAVKLIPWEASHLTSNLPIPMPYDLAPGFRIGFALVALLLSAYLMVLIFSRSHRALHDILFGTSVRNRS